MLVKKIYNEINRLIFFAFNIYIYIYIYICSHPQTDCFIELQIFSVARQVRGLRLGLKPARLYVRLSIIPLRQKGEPCQLGNYKTLTSSFRMFAFFLTGYQTAQFIQSVLHYGWLVVFYAKSIIVGYLVDKFTYLGSSVSSTKNDINTRLSKAWTTIDELLVIGNSDLPDKIKRIFF